MNRKSRRVSCPIFRPPFSASLPSSAIVEIKKNSIRADVELCGGAELCEDFSSPAKLFGEIIAVNRLATAGDSADDRDLPWRDQRGDLGDVADVAQNTGDHQAEPLIAVWLVGDVTGQ